MTIPPVEQIAAWLCILGGAWGAASYIHRNVKRIVDRIADVSTKVDKLWASHEEEMKAQLRRGMVEATNKGHGEMNSPFIAYPETADLFGELLPRMRVFYETMQSPITDYELMKALRSRFDAEMVAQFCKPHGYTDYGCYALAASLIRGEPGKPAAISIDEDEEICEVSDRGGQQCV